MRKGFSLLESLIGLTIMFLVVWGSLESFGTARRVFYRLRLRQENSQAAWAALDKIRFDVRLAGRGLSRPLRLGLLSAFETAEEKWTMMRAGDRPVLQADVAAGQTTLKVNVAGEDWAGRTLCLFDRSHGETATIAGSGGGFVDLSAPLVRAYRAAETTAVVLLRTTIYLDGGTSILRRKADASPAQPLCEGVDSFVFSLDAARCLASVRLALVSSPEKSYDLSIMAENAALGKQS
ncbi:MAG: hypothetical protein JW843_11860 [Candidatus Aminicenantes bacterium]|nr:hypothetical protein [Candidatus Aminicenantes bacterium]